MRVGGSTDDVNSTEGEVAVIDDSADRHINKLSLTVAMTKGKLGIWAYHGQEGGRCRTSWPQNFKTLSVPEHVQAPR